MHPCCISVIHQLLLPSTMSATEVSYAADDSRLVHEDDAALIRQELDATRHASVDSDDDDPVLSAKADRAQRLKEEYEQAQAAYEALKFRRQDPVLLCKDLKNCERELDAARVELEAARHMIKVLEDMNDQHVSKITELVKQIHELPHSVAPAQTMQTFAIAPAQTMQTFAIAPAQTFAPAPAGPSIQQLFGAAPASAFPFARPV